MEAAIKTLIALNRLPPNEVLETFFISNTTDSAWGKFFYSLKAWINQPGDKKQYSDEEIALFLDQLIDLVAAASTLHEANSASLNPREEKNHG